MLGSILLKTIPDSIGECHMISSIDLSSCYGVTSLPNSISGNENLRVLRLCCTSIERLTSSITTLGNIECLDLHCSCYLVELPEGIENLRKLKVLNLEGCVGVRSIPKGIQQLVELQKLGLFVLGEGGKCAQLSELANLGKLRGVLTVTGIEHVTNPDDAHMPCLKHKTNLLCLELIWGKSDRVNVEKEAAVLNALEPPSGIKILKIEGYPGKLCIEWIQKQVGVRVHELSLFRCLTSMTLRNFPNLKHLEGLAELPSLKDLRLENMPALESIRGGPFPSLVSLEMIELPKLRELWMVTERAFTCMERGGCSQHTSNLGQVQISSCLSYLDIERCPALVVKPHLPLSLVVLQLNHTNEQLLRLPSHAHGTSSVAVAGSTSCLINFSRPTTLVLRYMAAAAPALEKKHSSSTRSVSRCSWELLQHMPALKHLEIYRSNGLIELPESILSLTSLESLDILGCSALSTVPKWLGRLRSLKNVNIHNCDSLTSRPVSLQLLTSLRHLEISGCTSLRLLECLGELWPLEELTIEGCDKWPRSLGCLEVCPYDAPQQLPEYLTELRSLRVLCIGNLRGLTCLPQTIGCLTSLESLTLKDLHALQQLPENLGGLHSLRKLFHRHLHGLTSLPQSMCRLTSLEELRFSYCPGIKSLPEGIRDLTALQELSICGCPDLGRRCEGEDWHLIPHVSDVSIDGSSSSSSSNTKACCCCTTGKPIKVQPLICHKNICIFAVSILLI